MPVVVTGVPDDGWSAALAAAVDKTTAGVVRRRGARPGRHRAVGQGARPAALWGYLNEALVHGWDLAVATGQHDRGRPATWPRPRWPRRRRDPARGVRGGPVPFAEVVEPAPDAGPTERLANWAGHRRP